MQKIWWLMVFIPALLFSQASNDPAVQKKREEAIKYEVDLKLIPLIAQIQDEKETRYDSLLLERLQVTKDKELKIVIFKLFTETKNPGAKDVAIAFVNEEANSTRLSVMTDALNYLTTVMPSDAEVKNLLWDIIANTAGPDRNRFVIIALQFWAKTEDKTKGADLIKLYESEDYPNEPKTTILWLLGETKESSALDLIKGIASNDAEDGYRRATAIRAQANIQGESALAEITPFLSDSNQQIRLAVIESVAGFSSPEALKIVEDALRDNDQNVRTKALVALGQRKNASAVEAIAYRVQNEDNENVQRSALNALIEINNGEAHKVIGEVFASSRYPEALRFQALSALLKNSAGLVPPLLMRAIEKENINYPSNFLAGLAGRMSGEKGAYGDFYKAIYQSSSNSIRRLAQAGAKLNGTSL